MSDPRLDPPRSMPTYAVRAPRVSELRRVTAPGGRVPLSTQGVMPYHASPTDYWRWMHAGLEKLFAGNGNWASVRVTRASGITACLGMLFAIYFDLGFRRVGLGFVARPLIAVLNTVATGIAGRSVRLREPGPGGLFANYHIVAEVPR